MTLFILIVCVIALLFLVINFLFAPHSPDQEKDAIFECGFRSFKEQNRTAFNVIFALFGVEFMLFDLEVLSMLPFITSGYSNGVYGLGVFLVFSIIVTLGFVFELGKGALKIDSRQNIKTSQINNVNVTFLDGNAVSNPYVLKASLFNFSFKNLPKRFMKYITFKNEPSVPSNEN